MVDLAAMREAMQALGGDPTKINPLIPAELVIDHSVVADVYGSPDAFGRNVEIEFQRNHERFQFLRWGQDAFSQFKVVPPGTGIVHQVNIEYLARVVMTHDGVAYPDTCVGTDSHTTMQNGLGVLGWGVGGIEAEAAMLGQPISMLIPKVVGFRLTGELPSGTTATDLVLTITEMLRKHGVVGKFVEFTGEGVAAVPVANRATIGNMSPEFGSTCAIFPIDQNTLDYLRLTGRPREQVALVEAYAKEQGLWHDPDQRSPVLRGAQPRPVHRGAVDRRAEAPQDRIALADAKTAFRDALPNYVHEASLDNGLAGTFPASDPVAAGDGTAPRTRSRSPSRMARQPPSTTAAWSSPRSPPAPTRRTPGSWSAPRCSPRTPSSGAWPASRGSRPRSRPAPRWSWTTTSAPGCCPTWTSSASTWSATAAPPASATPGRCRPRSARR